MTGTLWSSQTSQPQPPPQFTNFPGSWLFQEQGLGTGLLGDKGQWHLLSHSPSLGRQWCEHVETILVEEEVTPCQRDLVPHTSLYHYRQLDLSWSGRAGLFPIYK